MPRRLRSSDRQMLPPTDREGAVIPHCEKPTGDHLAETLQARCLGFGHGRWHTSKVVGGASQ